MKPISPPVRPTDRTVIKLDIPPKDAVKVAGWIEIRKGLTALLWVIAVTVTAVMGVRDLTRALNHHPRQLQDIARQDNSGLLYTRDPN